MAKELAGVSIGGSAELRDRVGKFVFATSVSHNEFGDKATRYLTSPLFAVRYGLWNQVAYEEQGNPAEDCASYAFGRILAEPWGLDGSITNPLFVAGSVDIENFLKESGYRQIERSRPDDLVVYGWKYPSEAFAVQHFGVLGKDGMVKSKFGSIGPVLRHRLDAVLEQYGNVAEFFRKAN